MRVYDPLRGRVLSEDRLEALPPSEGWCAVRERGGSDWWAWHAWANQSVRLVHLPDSVRDAVADRIRRWTLQERLIERCHQVRLLECGSALGLMSVQNSLSETCARAVESHGESALQVAVTAALRDGFHPSEIAAAISRLDDEPTEEELVAHLPVVDLEELMREPV